MSTTVNHFLSSGVAPDSSSYLTTAYKTPLSNEVTLWMSPGTQLDWENFKQTAPEYSAAIDGFVKGPPGLDPSGKYLNADHHKGVDRLATRASCAQIHVVTIRISRCVQRE